MNKTIFQLDYKISMLIVSLVGIFVGFISNVYNVKGVLGFIFYLIELVLLTGLFFILYCIENKNKEFKNKVKYLFGDLALMSVLNIVFALFSITHIMQFLFITLSGIACLCIIYVFALEIVHLYLENKTVVKLVDFNKKIGDAIATPIVKLISKKTTND